MCELLNRWYSIRMDVANLRPIRLPDPIKHPRDTCWVLSAIKKAGVRIVCACAITLLVRSLCPRMKVPGSVNVVASPCLFGVVILSRFPTVANTPSGCPYYVAHSRAFGFYHLIRHYVCCIVITLWATRLILINDHLPGSPP